MCLWTERESLLHRLFLLSLATPDWAMDDVNYSRINFRSRDSSFRYSSLVPPYGISFFSFKGRCQKVLQAAIHSSKLLKTQPGTWILFYIKHLRGVLAHLYILCPANRLFNSLQSGHINSVFLFFSLGQYSKTSQN